jgi:hypothetical protein
VKKALLEKPTEPFLSTVLLRNVSSQCNQHKKKQEMFLSLYLLSKITEHGLFFS